MTPNTKPTAGKSALVLLIFALTGTTAAIFPRWLMPLTGVESGTFAYWLVYFLLITPIYQVLLLVYAFVFGQFRYFLEIEKKWFRKIARLFSSNKKEQTQSDEPETKPRE